MSAFSHKQGSEHASPLALNEIWVVKMQLPCTKRGLIKECMDELQRLPSYLAGVCPWSLLIKLRIWGEGGTYEWTGPKQ